MNWICESCGYENEYNDESQPTECQCCGELASEQQINQARRALERYHREQERERRLEQLRQEAIKQQKKIEDLIDTFVKGLKGVAAACVMSIIIAGAIVGLNIYKGDIKLKHIETNIKNITVIDSLTASCKTIMEHLSENALEFKESFDKNIGTASMEKDYSVMKNIEVLVEDKKKSMMSISDMVKQVGDNLIVSYENWAKNLSVSESNVTSGVENLAINSRLFWSQAAKNLNQFVVYISMKFGGSK